MNNSASATSVLQTNSAESQSRAAVLQAKDLHKTYRDGESFVEVLKGVNLSIEAGEMVAIIGASGSGKSTLLHVLGGLDSADAGEALVLGENIHKLSVQKQGEVRNKSLGFVYQFHHLLAEFSALENVAMPLIIRGEAPEKAYAEAESMIAKVGLSNRLSHHPSALSGGERQRIALARAMVTKPACILADEPTGNLDMVTANKVNELMFELNQSEGTAFLLVSHDLKLAHLMQKTYQMVDGVLELTKV